MIPKKVSDVLFPNELYFTDLNPLHEEGQKGQICVFRRKPEKCRRQGLNTTPGPSTARPSGIVRRSRDGGADGANKKPRPILATMMARPKVHVSRI